MSELPADQYDSDTLMSYQEWQDAGRYICKGSKSRTRDAVGMCLFSIDQTTKGPNALPLIPLSER